VRGVAHLRPMPNIIDKQGAHLTSTLSYESRQKLRAITESGCRLHWVFPSEALWIRHIYVLLELDLVIRDGNVRRSRIK
jgi:hypothetical protein